MKTTCGGGSAQQRLTREPTAVYRDGMIVVMMDSGEEIQFPVRDNPRLANGTPDQLNNIEISPFGLHWPDLDEDLSLRGILVSEYGQHRVERATPPEPAPPHG